MRDHPGVIAPPPLIALASIILGWLLGLAAPLPLPGWAVWPGGALALAGVALAVWAERRFKAIGTSVKPWKPTTALSLDGPYRFTRNPMYVGLLAAQLGTGLVLRNGWIAALTVASFAVLHIGVVRREEAYLSAKFGAEYESYRTRTRRWL
jgi:protein-S-isoprenylcysteine O-methyltransferase Ste14